jgi:hypothetical protein
MTRDELPQHGPVPPSAARPHRHNTYCFQRQFIPTRIEDTRLWIRGARRRLETRKRSVFDQIIVDIRIPVTVMPHCFKLSAIICPPFVGNFDQSTPKSEIQRTKTLTRYA